MADALAKINPTDPLGLSLEFFFSDLFSTYKPRNGGESSYDPRELFKVQFYF
jgi:hypothetical protein